MLKRIKRWITRVKCAFALFMLKNIMLSTRIQSQLEEYIERRQLLLSSWTREVDEDGNHTPWYKIASYYDTSSVVDEIYQESNSWCLIHYRNDYEAVFELPSYGFSFIFNRSGRIRPKGSLDSGYSFFMVRDTGVGSPYICIIKQEAATRNFLLDRLFVLLSKGDIENSIKMINMYCEIYHMYMFDDSRMTWSFGIQEYIQGVQNDGLYLNEELFWRRTNGNQ